MKFPLEKTELWTLTLQSDWGAVHMVYTSFSATSSHWCLIFFTSNTQFSVIQMLPFYKIFLSFKYLVTVLPQTKQFFTLLNLKILRQLKQHTYDIRESKWREKNVKERERDWGQVETNSVYKNCPKCDVTEGRSKKGKETQNQLLRSSPQFRYRMRSQLSA